MGREGGRNRGQPWVWLGWLTRKLRPRVGERAEAIRVRDALLSVASGEDEVGGALRVGNALHHARDGRVELQDVAQQEDERVARQVLVPKRVVTAGDAGGGAGEEWSACDQRAACTARGSSA